MAKTKELKKKRVHGVMPRESFSSVLRSPSFPCERLSFQRVPFLPLGCLSIPIGLTAHATCGGACMTMRQLLLTSGGVDAVTAANNAFPANKEIQGVWQKLAHVLQSVPPASSS